MKLQDLQYLPPTTLATSQTVYRVQRARPRPGSQTIGPLKLAPAGDTSSRFAVPTAVAGYVAESPETAVYESLVRREAVALSLSQAAGRTLLCLRTARPLQLLDLRPHASSWPVLQSLRFAATQEVAREAVMAGFAGIAYRSAQQHGMDCFVIYGDALEALRLVWRKPLLRLDGAMHVALASAIRGGQITVSP